VKEFLFISKLMAMKQSGLQIISILHVQAQIASLRFAMTESRVFANRPHVISFYTCGNNGDEAIWSVNYQHAAYLTTDCFTPFCNDGEIPAIPSCRSTLTSLRIAVKGFLLVREIKAMKQSGL